MLYALTFLFGYFVGSFVFVLKFKQRTEDLKKHAYKEGFDAGKIIGATYIDGLEKAPELEVKNNPLENHNLGHMRMQMLSDLKYEVGDGGGKGVY